MIVLMHIYLLKESGQWQKKQDAAPNNANKKVIFKNYTLFTNYASYAIYKQNKQSTSRWCLKC